MTNKKGGPLKVAILKNIANMAKIGQPLNYMSNKMENDEFGENLLKM